MSCNVIIAVYCENYTKNCNTPRQKCRTYEYKNQFLYVATFEAQCRKIPVSAKTDGDVIIRYVQVSMFLLGVATYLI